MSSYCEAVRNLPLDNLHRQHHDTEHGFKAKNDDDLFRRLILEINQAGLSFDIVLKKKEQIYKKFSSIKKTARYANKDINRLINNPSIIRNKLKIRAIIFNAIKILEIQDKYGSFKSWLDSYYPQSKENWINLFKKTFKFTGPEIVNEFLMGTCYLPGAHTSSCKFYTQNSAKKVAQKVI